MLKSGVGCLGKVEMGWSCHDWPTGPMVGFCARPTHLSLSVIAGEPPNLNPQQQQQKCRHNVTHRYHCAVETEHAVERKICLRSRNCKKNPLLYVGPSPTYFCPRSISCLCTVISLTVPARLLSTNKTVYVKDGLEKMGSLGIPIVLQQSLW